jgi:hypothetical protein
MSDRRGEQRVLHTFALKTPGDLFAKLKSDEDRLKADPTNSYAAFDFFVTAHALTYWVQNSPSGQKEKVIGKDEYEIQLLEVCSHLGNGAKHFELSVESHDTVHSTEATDGAFGAGVFNGASFQTGQLLIHLEKEPASALGGPVVEVTGLARKVVNFWQEKLKQMGLL